MRTPDLVAAALAAALVEAEEAIELVGRDLHISCGIPIDRRL